MSSERQSYRLADLVDNFDSQRVPVKESDRKRGKYPYYGASGIVDHIDSYIFDGEFLLVAEDGENLRTRKTPIAFTARGQFWVNNHAHILKANEKSNTRFLAYLLESMDISGYLTGSTMPKLTQGNLNAIEVVVPTKSEQDAIADVLSSLDDKIEFNRKTNETLEAIAKATFKAWFVDFDPVRTKTEGRPTGLPDDISALFPDSFEQSEIGEIPAGWRLSSVTDLMHVDPRRELRKGSLAPYLEMRGAPTQGHCAEGVVQREFSSGSKFKNGDTLLARITPCLENGKTALVDFLEEGETGWGSTEFIVLSGREGVSPAYIYYLSRSEGFRNHAIQNMVGSSGRQRVPSDCFSSYLIAMPTLELVARYSDFAEVVLRKIRTNSNQSKIMSELRDTLLPKLISGELRIPDAKCALALAGV